MRANDAAVLDALFDEDRLYDDDAALAARELPPRPWRASEPAVAQVLDAARQALDERWRSAREQARRDRMLAAFAGAPDRSSERAAERASEPAYVRSRLLARLVALETRAPQRGRGRALDTVTDDELRAWIAELEGQLGLARGSVEQAAVAPRRPSAPWFGGGGAK